MVRPYRIEVPDAVLDDLRGRLARTRWPDRIDGAGWDYGVDLDYIRDLCEYWRTDYDWRVHEAALNAIEHFVCPVDGLDLHFWHVRGSGPSPMPLLLVHGWPGSIVEFVKLIGPLTDPVSFGGDAADSFDVVVPSLPGFGFSQKPTETGWTVSRIAIAWAELMKRLGYTRWAAQGGDWGAVVTTALGAMQPEGLLGFT